MTTLTIVKLNKGSKWRTMDDASTTHCVYDIMDTPVCINAFLSEDNPPRSLTNHAPFCTVTTCDTVVTSLFKHSSPASARFSIWFNPLFGSHPSVPRELAIISWLIWHGWASNRYFWHRDIWHEIYIEKL